MLSLQAELLKKKKEFTAKKKAQAEQSQYQNVPRKKFRVDDKKEGNDKEYKNRIKNKGVEERNLKDIEKSSEEINKEALSRSVLEAKARLYDKLTSGEVIPEQSENSPFLVDFEQKAVSSLNEKHEQKTISIAAEISKEMINEDSEIVEYTDALGRTRKCLKKDISKFENMDKTFVKKSNIESENTEKGDSQNKTLLSNDMRREMERENWEQDAMQELSDGKIHYQSMREGENRELGVGYYSFSTNETEREEQLKMLRKMREDTKKEQWEISKNKDKKQFELQKRLEKIRQRKIEKLKAANKEIPKELLKPVNLNTTKDKRSVSENEEENEGTVLVHDNDDALMRKFKVREWDKNKDSNSLWAPADSLKPPKSWKDPHDERPDEFAPPSFYFDKKNRTIPSTSMNTTKISEKLTSKDIANRTKRIIDEVDKTSAKTDDFNADDYYNPFTGKKVSMKILPKK